jgi:HD-GYP domain-containing protein (c-di-GMP phosphodiesterase class II)
MRGYPERLAGDRIPLPSRIILVADTVEAMTSDRPYRKAMPLDAVLAEVRRFTGTQFDPNCASAMLRLLERHGEAFLSKEQRFDIHAFLEV